EVRRHPDLQVVSDGIDMPVEASVEYGHRAGERPPDKLVADDHREMHAVVEGPQVLPRGMEIDRHVVPGPDGTGVGLDVHAHTRSPLAHARDRGAVRVAAGVVRPSMGGDSLTAPARRPGDGPAGAAQYSYSGEGPCALMAPSERRGVTVRGRTALAAHRKQGGVWAAVGWRSPAGASGRPRTTPYLSAMTRPTRFSPCWAAAGTVL